MTGARTFHLNQECPQCPPLRRHFGGGTKPSRKQRRWLRANGWRLEEVWYPPTWPHGERFCYDNGCRCVMCVECQAHRYESGILR